MEFFLVTLLNSLSYGLLLFMLSSGLTLIFSMMGVLNFAHASFYMLGAYFAYVEHPFAGERSATVSKRLADQENLLTIPGDMFGAGQERFVRLAFANVSDDKIPAVLERLERFGA